jgi:hypothetical protein
MTQLELFDISCYKKKSFEQCFCSINDELEKLFDLTRGEIDTKIAKAINNLSEYLKRF